MKFGSIDKWVKRVPFESTPPLSEPDVIPAGQPDPEFEPAWTGTPVSLSDDDAVLSDVHDDGTRSPILADYTMHSLMDGAAGSDGPSVTGTELLEQVNAMIEFENAIRPEATGPDETGKHARRLRKKENQTEETK